MSTITVIECVLVLLVVSYFFGITLVWIYELRKNALYSEMQKRLKLLEGLSLSAALLYAKTFKIREDYKRQFKALESGQRFIYENVLFIARHSNSNKNIYHI